MVRHGRGWTIQTLLGCLVLLRGCLALCEAGEPSHANAANTCSSYHAGQNHVLRTYCDGPGKMTLRINGADHTISGGKCENIGGMFSLNAGVVTEMGAKIPADYVGLATTRTGPFHGAVLALRLDGQSYILLNNQGEVDPGHGSFTATGYRAGPVRVNVAVEGHYTC